MDWLVDVPHTPCIAGVYPPYEAISQRLTGMHMIIKKAHKNFIYWSNKVQAISRMGWDVPGADKHNNLQACP